MSICFNYSGVGEEGTEHKVGPSSIQVHPSFYFQGNGGASYIFSESTPCE